LSFANASLPWTIAATAGLRLLSPARGTPLALIHRMSKNINVNPDFYKVGGREHSEASDKGDVYSEPKQSVNARNAAPGERSERARAIERARGRAKRK